MISLKYAWLKGKLMMMIEKIRESQIHFRLFFMLRRQFVAS